MGYGYENKDCGGCAAHSCENAENKFEIVGIRETPQGETACRQRRYPGRPVPEAVVLGLIVAGCLACELIGTKDPAYMDLRNHSVPPGRAFLFGTDTLGRDIFSMIWYGGRLSLAVGLISTLISTVLAVILGSVSGCAPAWADRLLMCMTDILLSVPGLPVIILLQAALGEADVTSISFVIGVTGWMSIARVVRSEVRQIRNSEYVAASRCMGGGFFHILYRHLAPNFVSSIMFMVVMNIRSAIVAESTLSFMGIGLPVEVITWGSMLSESGNALLSNAWWSILIPGLFLLVTLLCITSLGNRLRESLNRGQSNL